jgi:hypothetical protein
MEIKMGDLKSRTISITDKDWKMITNLAIKMGFGKMGRGKTIVKLARDETARIKS